MNKNRTYKLPNGKYTKNNAVYYKEWLDLGEKFSKLLPGFGLYGFDPYLAFSDGAETFTISTNVANLILNNFNKSKRK